MADFLKHSEVARFFSDNGDWLYKTKTAQVNLVAVKDNTGWVIRSLRVQLATYDDLTTGERLVETEHLLVLNATIVADPHKIREALERLFTEQQYSFTLSGSDDSKQYNIILPTALLPSFRYSPLSLPHLTGPLRLPNLSGRISYAWQSVPQHLGILDLELQGLTLPYRSIEDLFLDMSIGINSQYIYGDCEVEIVVWPPATLLASTSIDSETITIDIQSSVSIDTSQFSIGLVIYRRDQNPERLTILASDITWSEEGTRLTGLAVAHAKNSVMAYIILRHAGAVLGSWFFKDHSRQFNNLLEVHRTLDPENRCFLEINKARGEELEDRISILLTILGLKTNKYGKQSGLTDGVDIVSIEQGGTLLLIECTVGDINNKGKIHKLHDRVQDISRRTNTAELGINAVLGVIFTNLPRAKTAEHHKALANLGISLLCAEEIAHLIDLTTYNPNTKRVVDYINACIPNEEGKLIM